MFSRNTPAPAPKARSGRTGAPGLSFIAPEALVSGDLATEGQVHVDGRIDGDVKCAQLIQGGEGVIAGSIYAEDARLAGTVEGTVSARTLIVEASAKIMGDVAYETISIEAGRRSRAGSPPRLARPRRAASDQRAGLLLAGAARRGSGGGRRPALSNARFGGGDRRGMR